MKHPNQNNNLIHQGKTQLYYKEMAHEINCLHGHSGHSTTSLGSLQPPLANQKPQLKPQQGISGLPTITLNSPWPRWGYYHHPVLTTDPLEFTTTTLSTRWPTRPHQGNSGLTTITLNSPWLPWGYYHHPVLTMAALNSPRPP